MLALVEPAPRPTFQPAGAGMLLLTTTLVLIAVGALVAILPGLPLIRVLLVTQVINGLLLPVILIAILRLVNDRELMGAYANGRVYNVASWLTVAVVSTLSLLFIATTIF